MLAELFMKEFMGNNPVEKIANILRYDIARFIISPDEVARWNFPLFPNGNGTFKGPRGNWER